MQRERERELCVVMSDNRERLCDFCSVNGLVVTETIFPHKEHDEIHEDLKSWTPADVLRLNRKTSAGVLVYSTVGMKFLDASF